MLLREPVWEELLSGKLRCKKSRTFGIASSEDAAFPSGVPPKLMESPLMGCVVAPVHEGTISGRPARCPA
jgi:hypothetical protein